MPDGILIFWSVGTDVNATIRVTEDVYIQVDIRIMAKSDMRRTWLGLHLEKRMR